MNFLDALVTVFLLLWGIVAFRSLGRKGGCGGSCRGNCKDCAKREQKL